MIEGFLVESNTFIMKEGFYQMKKFNKKDLFTIPNIMGYCRIILIPVFCYFYIVKENFTVATTIVLISSLSDLFDGYIARKFNQVTELGKALDPVADKLTHAALALCLAARYPLMWALLALMLIKEGYMGIMGLYFLKRGKMLNGAHWFGKVCTATLFIVLFTLFLFPHLSITVVNTLIIITMIIMLFTLFMYIPVFHKMKTEK